MISELEGMGKDVISPEWRQRRLIVGIDGNTGLYNRDGVCLLRGTD
jgi:hypothetical protein